MSHCRRRHSVEPVLKIYTPAWAVTSAGIAFSPCSFKQTEADTGAAQRSFAEGQSFGSGTLHGQQERWQRCDDVGGRNCKMEDLPCQQRGNDKSKFCSRFRHECTASETRHTQRMRGIVKRRLKTRVREHSKHVLTASPRYRGAINARLRYSHKQAQQPKLSLSTGKEIICHA